MIDTAQLSVGQVVELDDGAFVTVEEIHPEGISHRNVRPCEVPGCDCDSDLAFTHRACIRRKVSH